MGGRRRNEVLTSGCALRFLRFLRFRFFLDPKLRVILGIVLVNPRARLLLIALAVSISCVVSIQGKSRTDTFVVAANLRCEWKHDPLGIESRVPHFSWILATRGKHARDLKQTAYQVLVSSAPGSLEKNKGDRWDSGRVASGSVFGIEYGGKSLSSHSTYFWKVRVWYGPNMTAGWSSAARFTTALLDIREWKAHWIAAEPDGPPSIQTREGMGETITTPRPLPMFRHSFSLAKPVAQALLFISGLGHYDGRINGHEITESVLMPGWTDYRKRVLYDTYDVTHLLKTGENSFGFMLGNGMYNVEGIAGRYTKFIGSYGQPKLIVQMHLRFADGSETDMISDRNWKTAPGPILLSSTYGGEDFDARREPVGWDAPGFADQGWSRALEVEGPGGALHAERMPLMRPTQLLDAVKVTRPRAGVTVWDLGQNFSGWPIILVRGARGSAVKLIAGELLDAAGLVTQNSAHAFPDSQNSFTYILKGGGHENWHPRFSYYGFRYVQVETSANAIKIQGAFIHDDVGADGMFSSSDPLLGRIHKLIDNAVLSNMASVLTDCPHREKLGWLEQTHLAAASIMFNYDVSAVYRKMSDDMQDSQQANGMEPSIAPEFVAFVDQDGTSTPFRDSPEWGSAIVLSPWAAFQMYGDLANLQEHYASMRRYVDYLGTRAQDHMLSYGLGDWYDIGPNAPGESQLTGKGLTATAIYYEDLMALSSIARLLGKQDDSATLRARADEVKVAFNAHEFRPDTNQYDNGSQTANAMPLALDMVPEGHRAAVLANLIADIRKHNNHVTAGDVGFHYVVRALTNNGQSAVLYDMLSRTDPPSYGYQLAHGATTLTEAWDANPDSSQNHFMLGHAEEWFYRGLAGIRFDLTAAPDERIEICPTPVGDIEEAAASYQSVLGKVQSHWARSGDKLRLDVTVPAGAAATIRFPAEFHTAITEGGQAVPVIRRRTANSLRDRFW